MDCLYPISIRVKGHEEKVTVPCGRCIACRLNRSSSWAIRIMHELKMHKGVGCFITLTYNQQCVPWVSDVRATLVKKDVQDFMKRLRKKLSPTKVRFYLCGEYGEQKNRPHFHICLFGWKPKDLVFYKKTKGGNLYTSKFLDSVWSTEVDIGDGLKKKIQMGFVTVGNVTYDSANYVARYCTKLLTGKEKEWYSKHNIIPEFSLMSRRPGIGASWIDKYEDEVREHHNVIVKGKEVPVPRYYKDRVYAQLDRVIDRYNAADYIAQKTAQAVEDVKNGLYIERVAIREKNILNRLKRRGG